MPTLNFNGPEACDMFESSAHSENELLMTGGSCLIGPDVLFLTELLFESKKTVYATLELGLINESIMTLDKNGHYSRPDIFSLNVNETLQTNVRFFKDG